MSPEEAIDEVYRRIESHADNPVFIHLLGRDEVAAQLWMIGELPDVPSELEFHGDKGYEALFWKAIDRLKSLGGFKAQHQLSALKSRCEELLKGSDLLVVPMAAITVPAGFRDDGIPYGITLIGPAFSDRALATPGARFTGEKEIPGDSRTVRLAVVGAHLSGMPLNHQLTERGDPAPARYRHHRTGQRRAGEELPLQALRHRRPA